jgi:hypothetical protein
MHAKLVGRAARIRVRLPLGAQREAWDCRPFGKGRIVAPRTTGSIELDGLQLDLANGELRW